MNTHDTCLQIILHLTNALFEKSKSYSYQLRFPTSLLAVKEFKHLCSKVVVEHLNVIRKSNSVLMHYKILHEAFGCLES